MMSSCIKTEKMHVIENVTNKYVISGDMVTNGMGLVMIDKRPMQCSPVETDEREGVERRGCSALFSLASQEDLDLFYGVGEQNIAIVAVRLR